MSLSPDLHQIDDLWSGVDVGELQKAHSSSLVDNPFLLNVNGKRTVVDLRVTLCENDSIHEFSDISVWRRAIRGQLKSTDGLGDVLAVYTIKLYKAGRLLHIPNCVNDCYFCSINNDNVVNEKEFGCCVDLESHRDLVQNKSFERNYRCQR